MDNEFFIVLSFFTSFIIVLLTTPALIKVAYLKRLVDEPGDERKLHVRRIPTIGGIMIFAGTLFTYFLWYPFTGITDYHILIQAVSHFQYIAASMLVLFFIGVKDDIIGTAPVKKLVGHLMVAFILVIMGDIRITSLHGLFGLTEDLTYAVSVALSVFTYTVIVNSFNLIDGVDGLAAGVGTVVALAFGFWFWMAGSWPDAALCFALAGSLVGFLIFNFSPAKIFMGDSGSLTVGLLASILAIKVIEFDSQLPLMPVSKNFYLIEPISRPIFAMAVLAYPLLDTLRIFIYRAVRGVSPFSADRNHLHHKLLDAGLTQRQTVLSIYGYSIVVIAVAVFIPLQPNVAMPVVGGVAVLLGLGPILLLKKRRIKPGVSSADPVQKTTKAVETKI